MSEKKNIVFVLTQSLDSPSGLGRYGPISRELVNHGYQVEVITLHHAWDSLVEKSYIESGVQVNYVAQMHVRKEGNQKIYYSPLMFLWISLVATIKLTWALFRSEADVIHLGKPQPYNVVASVISKRGRPIYCDCDDYEAETNLLSNKYQKKIVAYFENVVVKFATGLTVNTQFTKNRYASLGFPPCKISYVPNGVERSRFSNVNYLRDRDEIKSAWGIPKDSPLIIYIGTLGILSHPIDLLLDAFKIIVETSATLNPRLLIVGSGEDFENLQNRCVQLGIKKETIFTGRISPSEIPKYYASADISVDPVRNDLIAKARCPLKIVESLSVGTPVVTSDVGDRQQMLKNGEFGVLVEAGNHSALANGLIEVLENKKARISMKENALAFRETWYWDILIEKFIEIYH